MQPREKALSQGFNSLSDSELLAIILRSGYKGCSAIKMAEDILCEVGGLSGLMKLSMSEIMDLKGIKMAKAAELLASMELVRRLNYQQVLDCDVISHPKHLIDWLKKTIGLLQQEYLIAVFLDVKNHVIGYKEVFKGSIDNVNIQARDIFAQALKTGAARIIIAHNHPSQSVLPSNADDEVTMSLYQASLLMNIPLMDHIIVSYDNYFSYKEQGRL